MDNNQQNSYTKIQTSPGSNNNQPKRSKSPLLWLLIVVLLIGLGYVGYSYKTTNDKLKQQSQKLSESYATIENFQGIIDKYEARDDFVAKYNDSDLSKSECSSQPVLMSDIYINDKFAVYRFLCANLSYPIVIGASKKLSDGTYEDTYIASTDNPNQLPGYIYDTEPEFFGEVYGATRF